MLALRRAPDARSLSGVFDRHSGARGAKAGFDLFDASDEASSFGVANVGVRYLRSRKSLLHSAIGIVSYFHSQHSKAIVVVAFKCQWKPK